MISGMVLLVHFLQLKRRYCNWSKALCGFLIGLVDIQWSGLFPQRTDAGQPFPQLKEYHGNNFRENGSACSREANVLAC